MTIRNKSAQPDRLIGGSSPVAAKVETHVHIKDGEILRMRERLNEILVLHTGQPVKRIQEDTERDYIMSADQGKEYGIIDDVIRKRV